MDLTKLDFDIEFQRDAIGGPAVKYVKDVGSDLVDGAAAQVGWRVDLSHVVIFNSGRLRAPMVRPE